MKYMGLAEECRKFVNEEHFLDESWSGTNNLTARPAFNMVMTP
jgi:hypothetical protein